MASRPLKSALKAPKDTSKKPQPTKRKNKEVKNRHSVLIGCSASFPMGICPSGWLEEVDDFTHHCSNQGVRNSPFTTKREEIIASVFSQLSRWKLTSLLLAEMFSECSVLAANERYVLDVTFMITSKADSSIAVGSIPENNQDLLSKISCMSYWIPDSSFTSCNLEEFTRIALTKMKLSQKLDSVLYFFDVESVYGNLSQMITRIADLSKVIACHFILFDEPIQSQKSRIVVKTLGEILANTVSKLTVVRSPLDCIDLPRTLARNYFQKKVKESVTILRPNSMDLVFGVLPFGQILAMPLIGSDGYVKPAGAESIEIVGFLQSNMHDLNGLGMKRRYHILNAYEEDCYKKFLTEYDPKGVLHTKSLLTLLCDSLASMECIALCRLHRPRKEKLYDGSKLLFGLLPNGSGSETWINRCSWISSVIEKESRNLQQKSIMVPAPFWTDENSLTKSTVNILNKGLQTNSVSFFNKEMDMLMDHASVIGHNPKWLAGLLRSQLMRVKSRDMDIIVRKWINELDVIEI